MDNKEEDAKREYNEREERWIYYAETGHVPVCWAWVTPEIGVLPDIQKESAILVKLRIKSCKLFKTGRGNNGLAPIRASQGSIPYRCRSFTVKSAGDRKGQSMDDFNLEYA